MPPSTKVTIWHNPRCSKSREALALLESRGVELQIVRYLDDPPDAAALGALLSALGLGPRELARTREALYGELGLADDALSDEAVIAAMVAHPRLIERPIVIVGDRAVIGRPLANVEALLEG